jgi:linoleoyl-CoA desaturase
MLADDFSPNRLEVVKKTAKEFNLPYNEYKTIRGALFSHFRFLKQMGIQPS